VGSRRWSLPRKGRKEGRRAWFGGKEENRKGGSAGLLHLGWEFGKFQGPEKSKKKREMGKSNGDRKQKDADGIRPIDGTKDLVSKEKPDLTSERGEAARREKKRSCWSRQEESGSQRLD